MKTFKELILIPTFEDRFKYLQLKNLVGDKTFGGDRYLNQLLYKSDRWRSTRDLVIIRDDGCDLGMIGYGIHGQIIIHHMNPITVDDVKHDRECVYDLEGLICTTINTHNAIHFGNINTLPKPMIERLPNDTCPWK